MLKSLSALVLMVLLGSIANAQATVSRYERKLLRVVAYEVMLSHGAEVTLSPEVEQLTVVKVKNDIATVEFSGIEFGPFAYECVFDYDLSKRALVRGSDRCN